MNNQQAKFILGAYRPDGRDATDAAFAEALAQTERDPELRQWLERQRAFDTAVAGRLCAVAPPVELKQAILAGVRASRPRAAWWLAPRWLAAAAAMVVLAGVGAVIVSAQKKSGLSEFAALARNDLTAAHGEHDGYPAPLAGVQARLASARLPLLADAEIDLAELRRHQCRSIRVGGREIFELCFQRDGAWFHLYAARREDFSTGPDLGPKILVAASGGHSSATWADAKLVYTLVTDSGEAALRRLI